ncbi:hypothetical protein cypCar_00033937 [Cyprinus carpio]|nr:hypothetical protein cypCar_00033937 [Cyprinus carpio]
MDKEPQTKAEPAKSTVNTTTTTSVNPSHQANGAPKTPPALTTVTTFHNQPTPTNRKVVQVNLSGDRLAPSFSPSERVSQASSSQQSPKTVSLPNTPGSTPLVRGSQNPSTATAARKISPQALLLGKSPSTSQAQMLLRAQMVRHPLILTSAVRPDVPALSSSSSSYSSSSSTLSSSSPRFPSTQLQSLTLRPPPPGTLTIPPNLPLKPTTSTQPPPLSCPRLPTFHLRPSQPVNAPGKDGASKTESPASQTAQTKAPVRHLTVPPPSLYAPAQAHALAKQKLNSSGLKRPHSQISIPQHPFNQRHTPPNSPPPTPKKPLPELKRCPSTQSSQSMSATITVPSPVRSHLTPPTLTLPLRSSSPGGSLLATKQLLRIALSSASAQCTNGQSKTATVSPPHDLIQSKPLIPPVLAKPECPAQPLRTPNPCPQLVQLSPSRQTTAATPLITTPPLASPQRASPPSPVLPLVSTSSILAPLQSLLTSQGPTQTSETSKEPKDRKEEQKEGDVPEQTPQDLKCPASQEKITQPVTVDQPLSEPTEKVLDKMTVCTEDSRTDSQIKTSQKNETLSTSVAPWPAEKDDQCEEMSTQSDNHSAISSLSSDMSPIQSSITQPLDMSPVDSCFPPKFHPVLERPPVQPPTVSQMKATEAQQPSGAAKPLVLTHLVEGFIIQEGLEPFPVSKMSINY